MSMYIILAPILFPILMGALLPAFHFKSKKARNLYVEIVTVITSLLSLAVMLDRPKMDFVAVELAGELAIKFHIDGLGMVFAGLVSFLWPLATLYAFEYMEHTKKDNAFFGFYTVTFGVTLGIAFSGNLMTMYMFYEMLTLATLPLVMQGMSQDSIRAGRKYMTYSIGGAAFAFIGFIFVYQWGETMDFTFGGVFSSAVMGEKQNLLLGVYVLAVLGFGVKAAIFPFHGWLPTAAIAPTPVTALLHAVAVVKAGAFAILRVTYYSFGAEFLSGTFAQYIIMAFAMVTILYGSARAVKEPHFKRRLAYSTVSNLSYIVFAASLMTSLGLYAAMSHIIAHAFIKIVLFYCAGAILHMSGLEYVRDMNGIGRKMPVICVCFAIAGMGLIGIPPMVGFVSKWNIGTAAAAQGSGLGFAGIAVLLLSAFLTAIYIFGFIVRAFSPIGENPNPALMKAKDPTWKMLVPVGILSVAVILLGIFAKPLLEFFDKIANGLM